MAQHDGLRASYRQDGETWHKTLRHTVAVDIEAVDLSALSEEAQDVALEAHARTVQARLNPKEGPLVRVARYAFGERGTALLVVLHTVVGDRVSRQVVLEDLERGYEQAKTGARIELGKKTTSVKAWAERLSTWAKSEEAEAELSYWRGGVASPALPMEGTEETVPAEARTLRVALSEEETDALLREVPPVYRTQVDDALLLALAEAFEGWTGASTLRVDVEGEGRALVADVDLSRTVGWLTSLYPVTLDVSSSQETSERLKAVKEQLRAVPQRGVGYGALRYLGRAEVQAELGGQAASEVRFTYEGQLAIASGSSFGASSAAHGEAQRRDHVIDVNAQVSGGRLGIAFAYSENLHRKETIEALGTGFVASLRRIIAACRKPEAGGYTPSDFPLAKVEQRWLDEHVGRGENVEDVYALSPMQEAMLFAALLEPDSATSFGPQDE